MEENSFWEVSPEEALERLLVFILSLLFPSPGETKLEELHRSSLTQQCLNATDPTGCRLPSSETQQHSCFSARDWQMPYTHPGGEDFHAEEKRTFHIRTSMPQLRAKASRLQPGPLCTIPACALEILPCSSIVPGPILPVWDIGKLP